jgi:hypothetical protein
MWKAGTMLTGAARASDPARVLHAAWSAVISAPFRRAQSRD